MHSSFGVALVYAALLGSSSQYPADSTRTAATLPDSIAASRAEYVAWLKQKVSGRGHELVDSVFTNLQYLGGFEAGVFPTVMERWSIALGVNCTHCHTPGKWASDSKQPKLIARQMAELSSTINDKLATIEGIKSRRPVINCATCHRGELKPARSVPEKNLK